MDAQIFTTLYEYNAWANRALWRCVEQISEEQFDQPIPYSHESIHAQVAHIMGVEYWWFQFLSTRELHFVADEDYATRETIRAKWDETEAFIRDYISQLTPDELMSEVKPPFWEPNKPANKVYEAMLQVANHSTDHRAQTFAALHQLGGPSAPQDLLFYLFDRAGVEWDND
jgi:uncharacterized damage-inducible protein DinB